MKPLSLQFLRLLVLGTLSATGCSLCCSPYTDDYVTFGSRTPRLDMKHGRVGSILSDQQLLSTSHVVEVDQVGEEFDGLPIEIDSAVNEEKLENAPVSIGQRGRSRY